jgi:hypothetical protein
MAAVEAFLTEGAAARKRRWAMLGSILIGVIILHIAAGVVAGLFVVAEYMFPPPANFVVQRDIRLPAKKREHKMNMAALDAIAPKPTFNDKLQSTRPTAFSLPAVPDLPLDQMLPLDPLQIIADQVSSLSTSEAMSAGAGSVAAGSGGFGKGMSFLGVQSTGQRILLLFDVSSSVTNKAEAAGMPLEKIQEETLNLIAKLPITARFGIIQFTQNYMAFNKELLPASDSNRAAATRWVNDEWVTTGSMSASPKVASNPKGLIGVLELAVEMKPDVIYVISDGSFQWKAEGKIATIPWNEIKKLADGSLQDGQKCVVNFIAFQPKEDDMKELKRISSRSGGKTVELKK